MKIYLFIFMAISTLPVIFNCFAMDDEDSKLISQTGTLVPISDWTPFTGVTVSDDYKDGNESEKQSVDILQSSKDINSISNSANLLSISDSIDSRREEDCDCVDEDIFCSLPEFKVSFKSKQERINILGCSDFHFCDFMKKAAELMSSPEEVSLIRQYGFGMGHVPLLLVWSSHLYDRLTKSKSYCITTKDIIDILSLILIIDLKAQVDSARIDLMKQNLKAGGSFAVDVYGKIFEQSKSATDASKYLKSKLFKLWEPTFVDLYQNKKLPKYTMILDRVKNISKSWNNSDNPFPIWVCCVRTARAMTVANWWGAWPSDRFGNWWDPQKELIETCNFMVKDQDYDEIAREKTQSIFNEFDRNKSWLGYFGDLCSFEDIQGEEYQSDDGF